MTLMKTVIRLHALAYAASSRALQCAPRAPKLELWYNALTGLVASHVLPLGFGGKQANVSTAAWYGDKILGMAVADELRAQRVGDHERLTKRFQAIVSNKNIAAHLDVLLTPPLLALVPTPQKRAVQVHDCGTMIEACVDHVHASGDTAAVAELAKFLVATAVEDANSFQGSVAHVIEANPKGRLLELGGTVSGEYFGGPDHAPIFLAVAALHGQQASAQGTTKKGAEQDAAAALLAQLGLLTNVQPTRRLSLTAQQEDESNAFALAAMSVAIDQPISWEPLVFRETDMAASLLDGEDAAEWFRRKTDLYRCLCAPRLFPHTVRSVSAWQSRVEVGAVTLLCVEPTGDGMPARIFTTPIPARSKTQAKKAASALAHASSSTS
eukprot:CAMPEP_0119315952 /NCGR_PEP_ID=MMETSP1333-20130426/37882_1 /TAXON_ID=418940 /ORGANISM="Scyphosphaera apsteinii, Strain RCC1455" /LENGTH=381 /DNA_ID=CAMNT_0007321459 /DNA_START=160 /DNA_END=1306 /DNA_ORIENTATION=-